jgi:2-(1,2-epoxy-1,2-dihydrophenyl)acetyl-CoA isomerase
MMSTSESLLIVVSERVMGLTLNRPSANAMNFEMIASLQAALKQAACDPSVRCVLISGSGNVFSAGQDLQDVQKAQGESYRGHLQRTYNPLIRQIRDLEKPVLAAINGPVAGAALGIALACDLRIAADTARLIVGFSGIGLAPDSAVSLFLPLLAGLGRATQYAFTNDSITADQALSWGLVNKVVPADELSQRAWEMAEHLAQGPIQAMGLTKRAFNKAVLGHLEQVLDYEAHLQDIAGKGNEHQEGVSAFLEKRPPRYLKTAS